MELYKLYKLLKDSTASKFVTRKRIKVNYLLGGQYSTKRKNKRFKTIMLRSDSCHVVISILL